MVSNTALGKVAGYGAVFVIGSGLYMKFRIQNNIRQSDYFQVALKQFTGSPIVKEVIGEPLNVGNINLGDTANNYSNGTQAKFSVTISGPKSKGMLSFETVRDEMSGTWSVKFLEFTPDNDETRKLILR